MCILRIPDLSCKEVWGKYVSEMFTLTIDLIFKTYFFGFVCAYFVYMFHKYFHK